MSMDALVEALGNDAGYRFHFFSLFANKKIVIICGLVVKVHIKWAYKWGPTNNLM